MTLLRRCTPLLVLAVTACGTVPGAAAPNALAYVPANATPPMIVPASNELVGPVWMWQRTQLPDGKTITPEGSDRYTLAFQPGGRITVRADCNRGFASYELNGNTLKIGPAAVTKMGCPPGSRDGEFLRDLPRIATYSLSRGELVLQLAGDATVMRFRAGP